VDFAGQALTFARAISGSQELSTKSDRVRVPLPDQAAAALDRLSRRADFTGRDELVFCNVLGRHLDASALRRRFKRALATPPSFGRSGSMTCATPTAPSSAASGIDLVTIQSVMGYGALATTGRYLHARPATDQAAVFTRAFQPSGLSTEPERVA